MPVETTTSANVKQAVPLFCVTKMEASLRFYVDVLGFEMKNCWIPDRAEDHPDGRIRWCWLELGEAAIMLQEFFPKRQLKGVLGSGVNVFGASQSAIIVLHIVLQKSKFSGARSRSQFSRNMEIRTVCVRRVS